MKNHFENTLVSLSDIAILAPIVDLKISIPYALQDFLSHKKLSNESYNSELGNRVSHFFAY